MDELKPFTVTITGTYMVRARDEDHALDVTYESLLRTPTLDDLVEDAEVHLSDALILDGHYSTIVRDDGMSDYDAHIMQLARIVARHGVKV